MSLYSPKKSSFRQNKYARELLRFLSNKIAQQDLPSCKDRVTGEILSPVSLVTISDVVIAADMKSAFVYFYHFEDGKNEVALKYFQNISGVLSSQFAKNLRTKYAPKIIFRVDDSIKEQKKVQALIDKVRKEV